MELRLPRENTLRLILLTDDMAVDENNACTSAQSAVNRSFSDDLSKDFKLEIKVTVYPGSTETKQLIEAGTKTVHEVSQRSIASAAV